MSDSARLRPAVDRLLRAPLAPTPPLAEIRRRGVQIRRRRRAALASAATLAVALAIAIPIRLLDSAGDASVRIVTPVEPPPTTLPPTPASEGGTAGDAGNAGGIAVPGPGEDDPATAGGAAADEEPPADDRVWDPDHRQDPGEGCRVWWHPDDVTSVGPGETSSDPGRGPRTCSYQATRSGGYEGSGNWTIEIERRGERIVIRSLDAPPCADDVVHAGDLVRVRLGASDGPVMASAGSGRWHLSVGTFAGCR